MLQNVTYGDVGVCVLGIVFVCAIAILITHLPEKKKKGKQGTESWGTKKSFSR